MNLKRELSQKPKLIENIKDLALTAYSNEKVL